MKVLFLDIDGVLNSAASAHLHHDYKKQSSFVKFTEPNQQDFCSYDFCPVAVSNLYYILKEVPDLKVVVSSMWRLGRTIAELQSIFIYLGLPSDRIIDKTPLINDDINGVRGEEIQEWLNKNPVNKYAILDDDSDMLPSQIPNFFNTDALNGLTFTDAQKVIEHLKK